MPFAIAPFVPYIMTFFAGVFAAGWGLTSWFDNDDPETGTERTGGRLIWAGAIIAAVWIGATKWRKR